MSRTGRAVRRLQTAPEARMDLDLRLVRYFVAVAEELHFGRAAARLYISQPALSKQIRKLEEQLGAPLLVRDSRHVVLTPRGEHVLEEARRLLAIAQGMQQPVPFEGVRIAHVFELGTSRAVADAYARAHPGVELREHAMDSVTQLEALLQHRLDVAILRVTPQMVAAHPTGWAHRLLRLEPLVLVGRQGDDAKDSAPLRERPLEVFGDPPESGGYSAHGGLLRSLERELGLSLQWLGTPGAFSHCLARLARGASRARCLEFLSYAERYAAMGFPVYWPLDVQPYYPWSLAWRSEEPAPATAALIETARALAVAEQWLVPPDAARAPAWLPADDPALVEVADRDWIARLPPVADAP